MKTQERSATDSQKKDQEFQSDKKRTYSEHQDSNQEDSNQQDSERKRRKQMQPHKMENDEKHFNLRDIRNQISGNQQQPAFSNITQKFNAAAAPMKSFKQMKEQQKQKQAGANYDSFFGQSLNAVPQTSNTQKTSFQQKFSAKNNQKSAKTNNVEEELMEIDSGLNNTLQQRNENIKPKPQINLFDQQLNEIDQSFLRQQEQNRHQKKALAEQMRYLNFQELPKDWSLKTSIQISSIVKSESQALNIDYAKIQKYMQYFVYSTDQRNGNQAIDNEQHQLQSKIQWLRSLRDVYQKFLQSVNDENNSRGTQMPFFYVKNNSFIALFKIEDGKPIAIVNPSKMLAKIIQDSNVTKTVVNISHDDDEEKERQQQKLKQQQEQENESDDGLIDDQDRLTYLLDNNNQNEHFNLVVKNQSQLYYFDSKAVQTIYNILGNYIGTQIDQLSYGGNSFSVQASAFAQIIAPSAFINCTYKEVQLFYSGNVAFTNKQVKFQMKLYGVIFPHNLTSLCQVLRSALRESQSGTDQNKTSDITQKDQDYKEIDILMQTDEQSRLFTYKKCLKNIKLNTNGFPVLQQNQLQANQRSDSIVEGFQQPQQTVQFKVMLD
eukprot:403366741